MEEKPQQIIEERARRVSQRKLQGLAAAFLLLTILALSGVYRWRSRHGRPSGLPEWLSQISTPSNEVANPYQQAIQKVEQDRGEPVGNKAKIDVPSELKLYRERNRFLAVQVAEWRKQKYEIPHDFAELAGMVNKGEFARLPALGHGYILYGVGLKATDELTHYDQQTGKRIPLFASEAELDGALAELQNLLREGAAKIEELKKELGQISRKDRALKRELGKQISETQKVSASTKARRELIASFYKTPEHRQLMVNEYEVLATLAHNFEGQSFDLNDASSRREFKIRLLSMLRAPARSQLEAIGEAYQQKFERPLPVTSLLRTKEYQRFLNESGNPNATRIDVPPHTTGLAFDIYTFYMSADEQQFLMEEIARLKREGRVEALRENRDHIHVFVFPDGQPPDESLVKDSLNKVAPEASGG